MCACVYIHLVNKHQGQWCMFLPGISALDCQSQFPQGPNIAIHHKSAWPEKEQPWAGGKQSNLANHLNWKSAQLREVGPLIIDRNPHTATNPSKSKLQCQ